MSVSRRLRISMLLRLALVGVAAVLAEPAAADIVLLANGEVHRGTIVSQTDEQVVLETPAEENRPGRTLRWPADEIRWLRRSVSPQRLQELELQPPTAWLEYAEELAARADDPQAAETARRLYGRVADLAPETLGRSAMLGLAALAASREEARHYRAAAYLLDPRHDAAALRGAGDRPAEHAGRQASAAVRLLRSRDRREVQAAEELLRDEAVAARLDSLGRRLTSDEARRLAASFCPQCEAELAECPPCRGSGVLPTGQACLRCGATPGRTECESCRGKAWASWLANVGRLVAAELHFLYAGEADRSGRGWGDDWSAGPLAPIRPLPDPVEPAR